MANPYLKSILSMSTAATAKARENEASEEETPAHSSGDGQRNPLGLSNERYEWLQEVMDDLVNDTDLSKILARVMKELHVFAAGLDQLKEEDEEKVLDKAYELDDLLAYSDLSPQFLNSGGLLMIRQFLEGQKESLKEVFAQCILSLTENNPPAQLAVIESGLLEFILKQLESGASDTMRLKYLGAVSGTARSDEKAFKGFLDLAGPSILSELVRSVDMVVAAKAARVLTSIAYTMQDSATYANTLTPLICENYHSIACKSKGGENAAELEYIRDFFDQYVPKELLDEATRDKLLSGLRMELQFKDDANIEHLVSKYA